MLYIFNDFPKLTQKEKAIGNISSFMKSVLVEVVAENYRHLMHESATLPVEESCLHLFSPPLRSRERIISGIFATAISRVAPRSYPEYRVNRSLLDEMGTDDDDSDSNDVESDADVRTKAGRVDYLSYFDNRVISCELKSGFANADKIDGGEGCITELLRRRWKKVVEQAASAQCHLRERGASEYRDPVSLALMTIGARRIRIKSTDGKAPVEPDFPRKFASSIVQHLSLDKDSAPEFVAIYVFPEEFRRFVRIKRGQTQLHDKSEVFMPAIAFAVKAIS